MDPDRPALEEEIEITPEMIEAGALAGWHDHIPPQISYDLADRIYRAMEVARIKGAS